MKKTGAQLILEVLLEHGVDTVFGYPGGAALNVYDALYEYQDRIKHILTAHEQGASHAADGYARATGKTGVVFATSGPGATNLVTGIATAYMDSVPMVAITSNVTNNLIGRDAFQEVYITGITMPITKHNFFVNRIEDLANALRQAFRIAQSGRKGPVLVDVTKDVTAALVDYVPERPLPLKERRHMKALAALAGIKDDLCYHQARHSFASLITLEAGVPIETISRMLGHSDISTTQVYARVSPKKLFEDMDKFIEATQDFKLTL